MALLIAADLADETEEDVVVLSADPPQLFHFDGLHALGRPGGVQDVGNPVDQGDFSRSRCRGDEEQKRQPCEQRNCGAAGLVEEEHGQPLRLGISSAGIKTCRTGIGLQFRLHGP